MKILEWILIASLLAGCAGTMQTARTNGKGNLQAGIEAEVSVLSSSESNDIDGSLAVPSPNVALRYGVTDTMDLGFRLGVFRATLQSKFMFSDPHVYDGMAVSFAPALNYFSIWMSDSTSKAPTILSIDLPLLFGFPIGNNELVISPKFSPIVRMGSKDEDRGYTLLTGGSLGFATQLTDIITLLPEIAIEIPFMKQDWGEKVEMNLNTYIITGGFGLLFGGRSR